MWRKGATTSHHSLYCSAPIQYRFQVPQGFAELWILVLVSCIHMLERSDTITFMHIVYLYLSNTSWTITGSARLNYGLLPMVYRSSQYCKQVQRGNTGILGSTTVWNTIQNFSARVQYNCRSCFHVLPWLLFCVWWNWRWVMHVGRQDSYVTLEIWFPSGL